MHSAFELSLETDGTSQSFLLGEGELTLGRDEACHIVIRSEGVAPHHATVWLAGTRVQVEGFSGQHQTLVNGYDISGRVEIECPATLTMGEAIVRIRVKAPEAGPLDRHRGPERSSGDPENSAESPEDGASTGAEDASAEDSCPDPLLGMGPRSASVQVQYALGQEIARGGMGRIYRGEDPQLKREVAIKVSSSGGDGDPRFLLEAEVLGNLPHPNIVPIHAMGEDEDGFPFYSMKLVKGRTLLAVIKDLRAGVAEAQKQFTRERLLTVFIKICDAMAFAHSKGFLHRDLKPENVMVGEFGEVLVMDWGLAKKLGVRTTKETGATVSLKNPSAVSDDLGATMDGEVLGTPQYMSPEQARGRHVELDERADIYSLGAILYSILTFRPPVEGATLDELLTKVRSGEINLMVSKRGVRAQGDAGPGQSEEMGGGIPDALRAVTAKAMSLEKEDRYQSVAEFTADIEAYLSGFATRAEDAGAMRQLVLLIRRHKAVAAMLLLMFAGTLAFTAKLIASERLANGNKRIAEENAHKAADNEKQALAEKESARRAAARALIALVEAAERELDGEEIERTLAEVPRDLRDQKWEYLNAKLESSDTTVEARDKAAWLALVPHPQKSGLLVTLQANGWIRSLDLQKQGGDIEDIFRCPTGGLMDLLSVARDMSKVAVVRQEGDAKKTKASHIEVLEMPSGKILTDIKLPYSGQFQLAFNRDGSHLFCTFRVFEGGAQRVQMRNAASGEVLWEREDELNVAADFSEDGKRLRLFSEKNGLLELDSKSGVELKTIGRIPWPHCMGYGAKGALTPLLEATKDGAAIVVSASNAGKFLRKIEASTGKILFENRTLSVGATGLLQEAEILVTLAQRSDRCVVLQYWHARTGLLIKSVPLLGNMKGGWRLVVHPKSGHVAVVNGTRLRCWSFEVARPLRSLGGGARSFEFAGDPWRVARTLSTGLSASLEIFDTRLPDFEKKPLASVEDSALAISKLSANKSGTVFAAGGTGVTRIYKRQGKTLSESFKGALPAVGPHWALNADGSRLWTGSGVFDTATGREVCRMDRTGMDVPAGSRGISNWATQKTVVEIAILKADWPGAPEDAVERAMILWNAETGERLLRIDAPDANGLCIAPDGKLICEAGNDMRIRLRHAETLEVAREFRAHDGAVTDVEWHPKLPLLVSASEDLTVRIWNLKDDHLVEELHGFNSQNDVRPERVTISPDGSTLAVKTGGRSFGFFEPESFKSKSRREK